MYDSREAQRRHVATLLAESRGVKLPRAQTWDCGAGRVRVRQEGSGIYLAEYSGVIGDACFEALRGHVVAATMGARVLVLDMCKVLSTHAKAPVAPRAYPPRSAPGVVICRADHHAMWSAYATTVAALGVMRVVFLESERGLALRLAQVLAQP
jgi:hypothetical protein